MEAPTSLLGYSILVPRDPTVAARMGIGPGAVVVANLKDYLGPGPYRATLRMPRHTDDTMQMLLSHAAYDHRVRRGNDPEIPTRKTFDSVSPGELREIARYSQAPVAIEVRDVRAFAKWFDAESVRQTMSQNQRTPRQLRPTIEGGSFGMA